MDNDEDEDEDEDEEEEEEANNNLSDEDDDMDHNLQFQGDDLEDVQSVIEDDFDRIGFMGHGGLFMQEDVDESEDNMDLLGGHFR